jgi:Jacalin-like lectin domain
MAESKSKKAVQRTEAQTEQALAVAAPVAVFQGYDSVTGIGLSTALAGDTKTVGGTSSVSYRVCTDLETLSNALEIDQSLSVGFGPIGSVDEKMKFVYNLSVTTYSVSIVVFSRHLLGSEVMTDVALKSGMNPPHGDEELREFFRGYGDAFLSSVSEGGEYYAVYTYYSQTREEQTELTASMKAHGIFEGGSVDSSLQTKISSFNSSVTTRVSFDQNMSGIRNPKFPDSDNIIAFALAFPSMELTAPAIVGYETLGYERVPNFGDFQPIAKNREFFVGNTVVGGLTKPLVQIQELQNQIKWIETVYGFYGGFADGKLTNTGALAKTDHDKINAMIEKYEEDPIGSFTWPKLPSLDNGTPELEYQIKHSPIHGGNGGGPFDDVNVDTSIPQQTRISALQLRSGSRIDRLMTTYTNTSSTWTVEHGGNGGGLSNKLDLRPRNVVLKVNGRSGSRVDHLTFTTSNGDVLNGGGGGGGPFSFDVPTDSFLLGFAGRSGSELDAIQFVYGNFEPARWTPISPS